MSKKTKIKKTKNKTAADQTLLPASQKSSDFNPDYSYVIKDLKRIGLLAGVFFSILVALTFFLR